jgi:hypothetical protein
LAPKRHTSENPDPYPPVPIDNPEMILRKQNSKITKVQKDTSMLVIYIYLPTNLVSLEDLCFDLEFQLSLFKTKSESSISETIFVPNKCETHFPFSKSAPSKSSSHKVDSKVWAYFYKI